MKRHSASYDASFRMAAWILFVGIVIAVLVARTHLAGLPLERDEGEYAYGGQLLLLGIPPYELAYSMKLPGTAAAYAAIMSVFGESIEAIRTGLALVNLVTVWLIFLLGCELLGELGGIVSAASYSVLSLMPHVLGPAAHATHFVVLFAVAGIFVLLRAIDRESRPLIFISGVLLGLAFLMKQPGLFFVAFGSIYLFARDWRAQSGLTNIASRNLLFISGAAVPSIITVLLSWKADAFDKFWFWTVRYATEYGSQVSAGQGFQMFAGHFPGVLGTA
ncbi:MAG TPA: glycosyltransferase family 39 protein, partial [Chthoniobacterales bacterium]|nr:glycosyltransferase family 39 protein [Chthoniobacterales bacterium]